MKKNIIHVLYHTGVVLLSAAFAFTLPDTIKYLSNAIIATLSFIEHEEFYLVVTEVIVAALLIVLVNSLVRNWNIRSRSRMAQIAGMFDVVLPTAFLSRRRVKKLKQDQGFGRNVMVLGSTGFSTIVDPAGDLHDVLQNCREAKVMLLNPLREGVTARAKSLADPAITPETFREQIIRTIDFLKQLKARQKNIRLKLYPDVPLMKLAILGDYLCMQHYPSGRNVKHTPEYVFRHSRSNNLFSLLYQYFVNRWFDPLVPEYDLNTDELVYRDKTGNEVSREQFSEVVMQY